MLQNTSYYAALLLRFIDNTLTTGEADELFTFIQNEPAAYDAIMETDEVKNTLNDKSRETIPVFSEELSARMRSRLLAAVEESASVKKSKFSVIKLMGRRWAAAAILFVLLSFSVYLIWNNNHKENIGVVETQEQRFKNDIAAPQTAKATLRLSNGKTVTIDSAAVGSIAALGTVAVTKNEDGSVSYEGASKEVAYNTLTVPRGSKPQSLVLADGSKIWVNVASSITFPTSFTGSVRKIEITGEAYFEVAHNAAMPFVVSKNDVNVEVLGTHFNVNTYEDEGAVKVTLLEGVVKVSKGALSQLVKPGQQAQVNQNNIRLNSSVDLNEVMAWKNGDFSFNGADINTIMRQLSRWYDVEVEYLDVPKDKFHVEMSNNTGVANVFKILETTGGVHFKIDKNKITVMK